MMQGKILQDEENYTIKMGAVTIDITTDVHVLLAKEKALLTEAFTQTLAKDQARRAADLDRYHQIVRIILTNHRTILEGAQGEDAPCQWVPNDG